MGVSMVEYFGQVKIDLTGDTVSPDTLADGITAHNATGDLIVGIASMAGSAAKITSGILQLSADTDPTVQPVTIAHGLGNPVDFFVLVTADKLKKNNLYMALYIGAAIAHGDALSGVLRVTGVMAGNPRIDKDVAIGGSDVSTDAQHIIINPKNTADIRADMQYFWVAGKI